MKTGFVSTLLVTLVFRRHELEAATKEVMSENGIPRRGTPDLLAVWESKPSPPR